jgi:hypothetical protein
MAGLRPPPDQSWVSTEAQLRASRRPSNPYCCVSEKIRISTEALNRGALTTYLSLRYAVAQLSRDEVLTLIDSQIADLKEKL